MVRSAKVVSWRDVCREPFRLFFPLGTLFGILGAGHWLAYALGWTSSYSGFYHASVQMGLFMACFIIGFLFTALPRFTSTEPATSAEMLIVLTLLLAQGLFLSAGWWVAGEGCFVGLLIVVAVFAIRRVVARQTPMGPPAEFVWIPISLLHGLIGTVLVMAGQAGLSPPWTLAVGRSMAQQGFVLGIVMGVGGFMSLRLMGHAASVIVRVGMTTEAARRLRLQRIAGHAAAGALFFGSFWMEGIGTGGVAYLLRAAVVTGELALTARLYRRPAVRDLYVYLLWVSLWMIGLGLWGAGLAPRYRVAMLHVVFLGGVSLMVFSVGTMVVLSHAGEGERLRRPLWPLRFIGAGIGGALAARLLAERFPGAYFSWLGVASVCWIAAAVSWLWLALPRVLRPAPTGTFERAHEEAKRQLRLGA